MWIINVTIINRYYRFIPMRDSTEENPKKYFICVINKINVFPWNPSSDRAIESWSVDGKTSVIIVFCSPYLLFYQWLIYWFVKGEWVILWKTKGLITVINRIFDLFQRGIQKYEFHYKRKWVKGEFHCLLPLATIACPNPQQ